MKLKMGVVMRVVVGQEVPYLENPGSATATTCIRPHYSLSDVDPRNLCPSSLELLTSEDIRNSTHYYYAFTYWYISCLNLSTRLNQGVLYLEVPLHPS